MPAADIKYNMADQSWANKVEEAGDKERKARAKEIDTRRAWYMGHHPDPLKPLPDKLNDNIKYNLVGRGIDKENEFIGHPERLEVEGGVTETRAEDGTPRRESSTEQDIIDALFDRFDDAFAEIKLVGMVDGHVFLKLYADDDGLWQYSLLDTRIVTVYWEKGRGSRARALWYRCQWKDGDDTYRQDIVPVSVIEGAQTDAYGRIVIDYALGWRVIDYKQPYQGTKWEQKAVDDWPYPFPPVLDRRNKSQPFQYYGAPTLTDSLIELNHAANFIASNTARIIKFHAHPRTIGVGVNPEEVNATSIDGFFTVGEGSEVFNLEMQSDLASSMNMLQEVKAQFFAQLRVVDQSSIKDRLGQVTNFGLRTLYSDQIELTEELRDVYGELACEAVARMAWLENAPVNKPKAIWGDPLPVNRLELLQAAEIELRLGTTSKETLREDLGRDAELEAQRLADEQREDADRMDAQMLRQSQLGLDAQLTAGQNA